MKRGLRTLIVTGLLMACIIPVGAQVDFGVRAGVGRTSLTQKIDLDYRSGSQLGYSMGVLADIPFYRRFSFRPEIALVNQGGNYFSLYDQDAGLLTYDCNYYSLKSFLNIAFNIPISGVRMAIFGGVVPDFYLGGKMKVIDNRESPSYSHKQKMKPFDLGVNSGISVEYKKIFFSIDITCGTFDRRRDKVEEESRVFQNNLTFSMGYFFR